MKRFLVILLMCIMCFSCLMVGCSRKQIVTVIATNNGWDSQMLHNEIAKFVVENAYKGYEFKVATNSSNVNWEAIIRGDVDLDIESWTDNVASYEDDVAKGDIVNVGVLVSDSYQGLYVPRYVIEGDMERGIEPMAPDLKTVEDLKKYSDAFWDNENNGRACIYGSVEGWMADEILYNKYESYNLAEFYNYENFQSEAALFESLDLAYSLGEPWVGYCYEPTWIAGKLDLVLLEDFHYDSSVYLDGQCEFPVQELKIVSSNKFATRAPELLAFFKKYRTRSAMTSKALAYLDESGATHEETAKWFLREYDFVLDDWLTPTGAKRVRTALNR